MSKYDVKQEVTDKFSLRGRVFHKLREDILSGKYQEHEELKEVAIGEEMGVSRTPVREAFRQLELEGLTAGESTIILTCQRNGYSANTKTLTIIVTGANGEN